MTTYHRNRSLDLDKPLWGAKSIGEAIGLSEREAFHQLGKGRIKARKVGNQWTTTTRLARASVLPHTDAAE